MGLDWDEVRHRVAALGFEPGDWLLFGSVPMLAHGLIPEVGDIDILARGRAWEQAAALGTAQTATSGDRVVHLAPDTEVFDGWLDASLDELFGRTETIDGMPVASLPDVLDFKRRLARPKDAVHIDILERAIEEV
jgi:hypothetical protein